MNNISLRGNLTLVTSEALCTKQIKHNIWALGGGTANQSPEAAKKGHAFDAPNHARCLNFQLWTRATLIFFCFK